MTDLQEKAMRMALERLESHEYWMDEEAIQALRQALAQPEQRGHCTCGDPEALGVVHFRTRPCFHYTEPLAQPEQKPVAWINNDYEVFFDAGKAACYSMGWIKPLYTAPPKREWVGLTDEEMKKTWYEMQNIMGWYSFQEILQAVEAKLKEKNT